MAAKTGKKRSEPNVKRDRAPRTGRAMLGLAYALGAYLLFLGIFLCWREMYSLVMAENWFTVSSIDVRGLERIDKKEIVRFSRLEIGVSIFDVDVNRATAQVEAHPWVKTARISRRLPDAILIEVKEQVASGLVHLDRFYYVNDEGVPFKIAPPSAEKEYVVIEGLHPEDFEQIELGQSKVRRALKLIREYKAHPMSAMAALRGIRFRHRGFELAVGEIPTTLVLGKKKQNEAFDRAAKLWRHLQRRGQNVDVIHLDNRPHPERLSVRLAKDNENEDGSENRNEHR